MKQIKKKNQLAGKILFDVLNGRKKASVSTQNLSEFYANIIRKVKYPLSSQETKSIIEDIIKSKNFAIFRFTEKTILKAIEISNNFSVSYWDALIAATMRENQVFTIVTENERDFKKVPWLKVINPFSK